ncbi:diguanylate cyclase [Vibrio mytili]|uniref:diguanylate cyclase n=1 Tax=Vibrio mytili TaxID=50718 RepID=UPI0039E795D1
MAISKLFSFYRIINRRIGLKFLASIFAVSSIFIPVTSYLSYQHAYDNVQLSAKERVYRLVELIRYNASMAAYLSDSVMATELVSSLVDNPEVQGARFTMSSGMIHVLGRIPHNKSDIVVSLSPQFSNEKVGELELFLDRAFIDQKAREKGMSLVVWQTFLLVTILMCVFVILRQVIYRPLNQLLEQISRASVDGNATNTHIQVSSKDEIGFLARNTNNLMNRISSFYQSEAEKNAQIVQLERQFRIIFEYSHAGIALLNQRNQVYLANQAFKSTLKYASTKDELIYLPDLFDDKEDFEQLLDQVRRTGDSLFRDFLLREGDDVWLRVLISDVEQQHHSDLEQFIELVVYDISDRAKKEKVSDYNAAHDLLTGIYNRRGAEARLKTLCEYARERQSYLAIVWLDLNDFKIINDEHGHVVGDAVLKELSMRLIKISRPQDIVARWGGDEFIVAMNLDDTTVLPNILQEMEAACSKPITVNSELSVSVGASIGVGTSDKVGYDVERLLIRADQLMYQVKRDGKRGYKVDCL